MSRNLSELTLPFPHVRWRCFGPHRWNLVAVMSALLGTCCTGKPTQTAGDAGSVWHLDFGNVDVPTLGAECPVVPFPRGNQLTVRVFAPESLDRAKVLINVRAEPENGDPWSAKLGPFVTELRATRPYRHVFELPGTVIRRPARLVLVVQVYDEEGKSVANLKPISCTLPR